MNYNMKIIHSIFIMVIITVIFSCSNSLDSEADIPLDINEFIKYDRLPDAQSPDIFLEIPIEEITCFKVLYGKAHDCPMGCSYSLARGIKRANKIGWIMISDLDGNNLSKFTYFNIDTTDHYFYTDEFWDVLEEKDPGLLHYGFFIKFASDYQTSSEVLYRLAESLYGFIHPGLGWLLLEHPNVISNREILTEIANLPNYDNPDYPKLREKAKELLGQLGG